jgi:hypothetical protein
MVEDKGPAGWARSLWRRQTGQRLRVLDVRMLEDGGPGRLAVTFEGHPHPAVLEANHPDYARQSAALLGLPGCRATFWMDPITRCIQAVVLDAPPVPRGRLVAGWLLLLLCPAICSAAWALGTTVSLAVCGSSGLIRSEGDPRVSAALILANFLVWLPLPLHIHRRLRTLSRRLRGRQTDVCPQEGSPLQREEGL